MSSFMPLYFGLVSQESGESCSFPTSGLTSYWRFDESAGSIVYDVLGTSTGTTTASIINGINTLKKV